jgi:SAM-dependent methyltransferase
MTTGAAPRPDLGVHVAACRRTEVDLFLISFLILFLELTCIRWFGGMVIFLTFFTNLVLMACFLGMSVGCLAARRPTDLIDRTIPLAACSVLLSCATLLFYYEFGRILVDVGSRGSPQQVFFGTEYLPRDPSYFVVPIEALAGLFFVLIAAIFVGLGQEMGRAFDRISNRVAAYTMNVLGSLAGIVAFGVASYLRSPPVVWFAISMGLCLSFVKRSRALNVAGLTAILILTGIFGGVGVNASDPMIFWSPYSKINHRRDNGAISSNNIGHQWMVRVSDAAPAYMLPYLLNRDSGGKRFDDVLIIGAGSGNDVQAALAQGARHVDAVEIDPVIHRIGRTGHPDRPFSNPRVSVHIDDGRSFVRRARTRYDLVSYAVVDSLVLHSGHANLRLESFLFTEEALRDIKARLKPGGVFAMYNSYRRGWVVGRLAKMAERVFGTKPIVVSLPYQERISPQDNQGNHFTLILAGGPDCPSLHAIRSRFVEKQAFWINDKPRFNRSVNAFGNEPPEVKDPKAGKWQKIGLADVDTAGIDILPSDDWPFLYLREPTIPALNWRWIGMVAALSLVILLWQAPIKSFRPSGQMFFLGAGFMLLETKGVVQMALLFGSTWVVNSIVFFAILVMILLSNLFVIRFRPRRQGPFYVLLIASLALNALVPLNSYLGLPAWARMAASCGLVFIPVFIAGIVFALAFRESREPDVDLGSNIGGVILGGLTESFSLVAGFNALLLVAAGYYLLSALLARRSSG